MTIRHFSAVIGLLALAATYLPTSGWAADANVPPAPQIGDVAIRNDGVLAGQLVDGQNAPQSGVRVSILDMQNHEVAASITDNQGSFAIGGVRGGVYQVVTPQNRQIYRIWAPGIAPPSAQLGLLLIAPREAAGGEVGDGMIKSFITNPLVIGGAVVTAVAVPVVIVATHKSPNSP